VEDPMRRKTLRQKPNRKISERKTTGSSALEKHEDDGSKYASEYRLGSDQPSHKYWIVSNNL